MKLTVSQAMTRLLRSRGEELSRAEERFRTFALVHLENRSWSVSAQEQACRAYNIFLQHPLDKETQEIAYGMLQF